MPVSSQRAKQRLEILASPVWALVLSRVEEKLDRQASAHPAKRSISPSLARESASAVLARAHAHLLTALEASFPQGQDAISEFIDDAVALVRTISQLWLAHTTTGEEDRLPAMVAVLARQLSAHEHGVLAGELTYSLSAAEAEQPAARMRQSLSELAGRDHGGLGDLISVQTAAIALAALLLRAAGNIDTGASASEAPERRTATLDRQLQFIGCEIAGHAEARRRSLDDGYDSVGHYLASAMRVPAPPWFPDASSCDAIHLECIRPAWLHVAALEHLAVCALDQTLPTPSYRPPHETLSAAVVETSVKVLCGGRLLARAGSFRHEQAWRATNTALTYAQEMYINGLPGDCDGSQRAQAMTLTHLVRSTVAIAVIDLAREADTKTGDVRANYRPDRRT